jgi:hypothetical protein
VNLFMLMGREIKKEPQEMISVAAYAELQPDRLPRSIRPKASGIHHECPSPCPGEEPLT